MVEILLNQVKVDPFKEDDQGNTILHVAEFDSQQTVNLLLATGARNDDASPYPSA